MMAATGLRFASAARSVRPWSRAVTVGHAPERLN